MTDVTQGDETDTVVERTKIANRLWLASDGKETDEEKAVAVSYEFLGRTKGGVSIPGDGKSYSYQIPTPGTRDGMLAGFGALTLMGNITNTWMGDKGDRAPTAHDAIADRFALLDTGVWVDRAAAVGARVDRDKLAEAVVNVAARKGQARSKDDILAKFELDAEWMKAVSKSPEFATEYAALMGRTVKSSDALLAGL